MLYLPIWCQHFAGKYGAKNAKAGEKVQRGTGEIDIFTTGCEMEVGWGSGKAPV